MKERLNHIRGIVELIRNYGIYELMKNASESEGIDPLKMFSYSNTGFKIAQLRVLELQRIESEILKKYEEEFKTVIRDDKNNKEKISQLRTLIKYSKFFMMLLEHCIDAIAWTIYGGKREIISRFYLEERGNTSITDKGFEATLAVAAEINENPMEFALLADLTSNIQVGDIHKWTTKGISIIEVKTGEKNEVALNLFKFYELQQLNPDERIENIDDKKFKKQMQRMQRQKKKTSATSKIINTDKGPYQKDPNTNVEVYESINKQSTYHNQILDLIEKSKENGFAEGNVYDVINIGVYRGDWRKEKGPVQFKSINKDYETYEMRQGIGFTICEPLFCKPFPEDIIMQIVSGEFIILIGVNLQKLIDLANELGGNYRWSTRKELGIIQQHSPIKSKEIVTYDNRAIITDESKHGKGFMMSGFIVRLVFDHLDPKIELLNRIATSKEKR